MGSKAGLPYRIASASTVRNAPTHQIDHATTRDARSRRAFLRLDRCIVRAAAMGADWPADYPRLPGPLIGLRARNQKEPAHQFGHRLVTLTAMLCKPVMGLALGRSAAMGGIGRTCD
jgi:hypothetical protein